MKKLSAIVVLVFLLVGCGSNNSTKEVSGSGESVADKKGDKATAEITMKGDEVVAISLDETKDGKSKKELGENYNMKAKSSINAEWDKQVEFLENYIKKHGLEKVKLTNDGTAKNDDVLAGCTISLSSLMEAANQAKDNAK